MSIPQTFRNRIPPRALRHAGRAAGLLGLAAAVYATVGGAMALARETRRFRDASGTLYRRWTQIPAITGAGTLRIHVRMRDVMTNAEPIVLVHGFGIGSSYFVPLAARLSHYAPVYAPDLPGHGPSDHDARPLGVSELAQALGAWMDAMGLRGATLVGHSLGCQVAAHAVAARPQLASRLVLMGPTADPAARSGRQHLQRGLRTGAYERPGGAALMAVDYSRAGTDVLRHEMHAMIDDRLEDILPRLSCPVFVVRGERDRIVSQRWAEEVARLARAPEPMVVPGWGHAVHYDDPDTIAALIVALGMRSPREQRAP
jgi:2-hydroxy-6-oxonona-2,4-dienedioate hydrolase